MRICGTALKLQYALKFSCALKLLCEPQPDYKHDKHVTQSILFALIPNLYHGCISSSKMDDLDLSFFVRKCMFMTSPHSARRWIA